MEKSASNNDPLKSGENELFSSKEKALVSLETIAKVRYDFRKNRSIKEICRTRKLSRNTVRKILRSEAKEFTYQRSEQPFPQLGEFKEDLEKLLSDRQLQSKKYRPPLTRIHESLQRLGYSGGYDSVRRYARKWSSEQSNTNGDKCKGFIPMSFRPGEAFQFDWSEERVELDGHLIKVHVAHITLCHSRMRFSRIYRRETLEMVLDAHVKAFDFFEGHCERGIYDNMKTAVTKILKGKDRQWNHRFLLMISHYAMDPDACNPASGWEKGRVERGVQTSRADFFKPIPKGKDLETLNRQLLETNIQNARHRNHPEETGKTIWDIFLQEKDHLIQAAHPFEACSYDHRRVSKDSLVRCDRNRYSVPSKFSGKSVDIKVYVDKVRFLYEGHVVAEHRRIFDRDVTEFSPWHYLDILERKPGAIKNGAPFEDSQLPSVFRKVKKAFENKNRNEREFVEILCATREHGLQRVIEACERAVSEGVISKEIILNYLYRENNVTMQNFTDIPEHLTLKEEPNSDCSIYDRFLKENLCQDQKSSSSCSSSDSLESENITTNSSVQECGNDKA